MPNIPLVSLDVAKALIATMDHEDEYFTNYASRLHVENPLMFYLLGIAQEHSSTDFSSGYMKGLMTAYALIENQMDANALNQQWNDDD